MPMLDGDDRIIGTDGRIFYRDPDGDDGFVEIPITMWSLRSQKSFQDLTTSEDYDNESNLVYPKRVQTATETGGEIEGRFRLASTPQTFVAAMYSGDAIPLMYFYLVGAVEYGHGYFNVSEFLIGSPYDGVVNFSCRIIGYGKFEPYLDGVLL